MVFDSILLCLVVYGVAIIIAAAIAGLIQGISYVLGPDAEPGSEGGR